VLGLSANAIHHMHAPPAAASAAIHVYGGPLFNQHRHMWNPDEGPVDDAGDLVRTLAELRATGYLRE
jgi:predicted metal-dependent enzyme (double-stranded beta helix superfamily)